MDGDTQTVLDQYRQWSTEDLVRALIVESEDYEIWALSAELQRRQISPSEEAVLKRKVVELAERAGAVRQLQHRVDVLLRRGIIFAIFWAAGIGSVIAMISGLKAKKIIEKSGGEVSGMRRVWFCLIAGGLGILIWGPIFALSVLNNTAVSPTP